ncbi:MAG: hydrogenase maturation protease [Verrucomicrobiae bacterium]|nr:hydrogenase maturation protease [Verrucomicrobiae bacterium]
MEAQKPILLLGLGNDILSDDAIGLIVARELQQRFAHHPLIEVQAVCEMGLGLLDYIVGHRVMLVVDSVQTGKIPPGQIHEVGEKELPTLPGMSPHFLGVGEILTLGRRMDYVMPEVVGIFAVEVADASTISEQLTPPVAACLPQIIERAAAWLTHQALQYPTRPAQ